MLTVLSNVLAQGYSSPTLGNLLWLAVAFFILAVVAYIFGAKGIAGMSAGIGRTMMMVFLVLFVVVLVFNFVR